MYARAQRIMLLPVAQVFVVRQGCKCGQLWRLILLAACRSLSLMRSSLKQLFRCSGCSGDAATSRLYCRRFRCAAQHPSATAAQVLKHIARHASTSVDLCNAVCSDTQLDAALQVASNVSQSQAALQLLVPQGDYAAALDVMEDIRVRSQAVQCLSQRCAGMQVCSTKLSRACTGMFAWQQPSAAQSVPLPAMCRQPGLTRAPACQCLPKVLLSNMCKYLQCSGPSCS